MLPAPAWAAACNADVLGLAGRLGGRDKAELVPAIEELKACGQGILPALMQTLKSGDVAQRRGSIIGLALLPSTGLAADDLIVALGDGDVSVRSLAAHALFSAGSTVAPQVAAGLASDNPAMRSAAAYSLILMKEQAIPALIGMLTSDDLFARAKAAWLLGRLGPAAKSAIPALIRALDTSDVRAMHVTAEAIDLIGPDPVMVRYHLTLLGTGRDYCPVRKLGASSAPILVRLLTRPGTPTGQIAFRTLSAMGHTAVPALKTALASGTPSQRTAAALLLVDIDRSMVRTLPQDIRSSLAGASRQE